eukprot:GEMP01043580.1.p1 GENE.GEMP01043580.1~~GEMP01043580.1.p1  ORF type:complete len:302 (+),score=66.16 GEMP01043580.1:459-1364(+)
MEVTETHDAHTHGEEGPHCKGDASPGDAVNVKVGDTATGTHDTVDKGERKKYEEIVPPICDVLDAQLNAPTGNVHLIDAGTGGHSAEWSHTNVAFFTYNTGEKVNEEGSTAADAPGVIAEDDTAQNVDGDMEHETAQQEQIQKEARMWGVFEGSPCISGHGEGRFIFSESCTLKVQPNHTFWHQHVFEDSDYRWDCLEISGTWELCKDEPGIVLSVEATKRTGVGKPCRKESMDIVEGLVETGIKLLLTASSSSPPELRLQHMPGSHVSLRCFQQALYAWSLQQTYNNIAQPPERPSEPRS